MKNILHVLFFIFICNGLLAQVVINEIMYNSPDSNQDSLEYIELYNNGSASVNLAGYNFTQGVGFTFPSFDLGAGEYVVVCNNASVMSASFGVNALQWTSGALNNGGEDIELVDAAGMVVDYVDYDDELPWPLSADGDGPSLELCDASGVNDNATLWLPSPTATGVIFDGTEIFGTPGAANNAACPVADHIVTTTNFNYSPQNITITVGETVKWENTQGTHNVNGAQTTFPNNPESFFSGDPVPATWDFFHTFNTVGTYDYQCDQHVNQGMVGTVTVVPAAPNDIVINEILYNIPGVDNNLDFIELYNRGDAAVNLEGYKFIQGVELEFPAMMLGAGEYLVVTEDPSSFNSVFGVASIAWTSGGLNDNGEFLTLANAAGEFVDVVEYNDGGDWPRIADGEGPSLILCDPNSDNSLSASWGFSNNPTGVVSGGSGNLVYASPGVANNACPTVPHIFFENALDDMNEGDVSKTFRILMANIGEMDTASVELMIESTSTATNGDDYVLTSNVVTFSPAGLGNLSEGDFEVSLLDDTEVEGSETIVLTLVNPTNGAVIASTGDMVLTIIDNDGIDPDNYPLLEIQDLTTVNDDFIVDSIDVQGEIRGIVYGVNLRPGGLEFTIVDKNDNDDGIGVFDFDDFDYTVTEGDEVAVLGSISQFRGLTQMRPDTVILLSQGNALFDPEFVTKLDEDTESKLVRINNLSVVSSTDAGGTNYVVTNGTDEFVMRIDADVDVFGTTLPATFDAIGIGGQYSEVDGPYDVGYQFLPRYMADILGLVSTINPELEKDIRFFPNPTSDYLTLELSVDLDQLQITNTLGQVIKTVASPTTNERVDVSNLPNGYYNLTFSNESGQWTSTFIKM